MASCTNCGTEFSFMAALKSFTPWSIKCSGCNERIRSSILTFFIAFILFIAFIFLFVYLTNSELSRNQTYLSILVIGFLMEILWFLLLKTGVIKSNLVRK